MDTPHRHSTTRTQHHTHSHSHSHSQQHKVTLSRGTELGRSKRKNLRSLPLLDWNRPFYLPEWFDRVFFWFDGGFQWFDRGFVWSKHHSQTTQNHGHLLFRHSHWLLEGSQATVKPPKTRTNHGQNTNQPQKPRSRHKPSRVTPNRSEPNHTRPSRAEPSHTTPHHAKTRQAKTGQAEQSQAIGSRPFPVEGDCGRCQRLTHRSPVDLVGKGLRWSEGWSWACEQLVTWLGQVGAVSS